MMARSPCCDESGLKKGPWTPEEDQKLVEYIDKHGHGSWRALPKLAGLNRCGKSCRLRWTNYLRPDIKRGKFTDEEEQIIIHLHSVLGNKWSAIAGNLQGRTDNEIKNYWNTHLKKKLLNMGIDPVTHRPRTDHLLNLDHLLLANTNLPQLLAAFNLSNLMNNNHQPYWDNNNNNNNNNNNISSTTQQLAKVQLLQNLVQFLNTSSPSTSNPNFGTSPTFQEIPRISEYLQLMMNSHDHPAHHHDNNLNGHFHFGSGDQSQILNNFPNIETPAAALQVGGGTSSYAATIVPNNHDSMPPLVSASPEDYDYYYSMNNNDDNHQIGKKCKMSIDNGNNPTNFGSNPSSTSTLNVNEEEVVAWGEVMDDDNDEASDSYWKDIIDQASSLPWTPT